MNLIINGNKVEFTDLQAKLIKDTLESINLWNYFDPYNCSIDEFMDLCKREFLTNKLISFLRKDKGYLKSELGFELIGIMCDEYCNVVSEHLNCIRLNMLEDCEFSKQMNEMNQEFLEIAYKSYFNLKNYLSDIESIIQSITISLLGELIYPKYNSFPSIEEFQLFSKSVSSFNDYLELLKKEFIEI